MQTKKELIQWIEDNKQDFIEISDEIWENPEIALKEFYSSKLQAEYLEKQGFRIQWDIGGLNTAFSAEWGEGKPVIGFAGEYDALSGLSQKNQPTLNPVVPGGLGQGCGHNLLGVGCLAAAMAVKTWLQENGKSGTVIYYGCPAEEAGDGKVYMTRAGAFDNLDAAFNFHPDYINSAVKGSCVGVKDIKYRFHGTSAHAGGSPHLGRSALDAVELMNVGVNYLREHVTKNVRIHYTITHGGDLPNVVPPEAEVWYFIRAHENKELEEVAERVRKIAEGAAMMTETKLEVIFQGACSKVVSNYRLADLQYEAMQFIGPIEYTEEELEYAEKINQNYPKEIREGNMLGIFTEKNRHLALERMGKPLLGENFPSMDEGEVMTGSTDVGDMSQVVPLSMLSTACWATGAPGHTWGIVATGAMSIGHKGMLHAAKIMALAAVDLFENPQLLQEVREEFEKSTKDAPYQCPIPDHIPPKQFPNPLR